MSSKRHTFSHDRITAQLVLVVVFGLLVLGGLSLYMTGIFAPAVGEAALSDTKPLNLPTPPVNQPDAEPKSSLLDLLFASASAESAPLPAASGVPASAEDLDAVMNQIVTESQAEEPITDADAIKVDRKDLSVNKNLPKDWFNVLLLGIDTRTDSLKNSRSDVMIVASVNGKTGEIKLTSLARDLYVPIPGSGGEDRLNVAFARGGWELAVKTVNQVFELNIQNYVAVNFKGLSSFIDSLGGVDIELVGDEYAYINYNVAVSEDYEGFAKNSARRTLTEEDTETKVHLDGLQAVGYARIRKLDNDLKRNSRQRILLGALLDKLMPISLNTVWSLNSVIQQYCEMDLPMSPGTDFGYTIYNIVNGPTLTMSELSIPTEGTYHNTEVKGRRGDNMIVLVANLKTNVEALHTFIYGEYIPADPAK